MSTPRTFVRGLVSETYGLQEFRRRQLAASRVRGQADDVSINGAAGYTEGQEALWRVGPGDDPFLTQTLQVHLVDVPARGKAKGHGHQNEAAFYILSGRGYEIHDGQRYDWATGDLVFVHTDSVHQHFNPYDEPARTLVVKAKCLWMFMGLIQQGRSGPIDRETEFGPREDWSHIWTPDVLQRKKVITPADTAWETTPLGRTRTITSPTRTDARLFSVDTFELHIPTGSRSGRYWKMADEIYYVLDGTGHALQWEVQAEIADKYHARIALQPTRHTITKGDTLYVPQNHVCQLFADPDSELRLLSAQNRIFKHLGYDNIHYLDQSPEYSVTPEYSAG
jgi:quercetin dioxygenase-like cupin family protein